jgi:hypothetical protein
MTEWFTAAGSAPFTVALLIMIGIAVVELIALVAGFGLNAVVDDLLDVPVGEGADGFAGADGVGGGDGVDGGPGALGRSLDWLYVGHLPVLAILIVFLTIFGLLGLTAQGLLRATAGSAAPAFIAVPVVLLASLLPLRLCVRGLAKIFPRDDSSAVDPATFVGATALVVGGGGARAGHPAQARLVDGFGTTHYVLVEPVEADQQLPSDSAVLLVEQLTGGRFAAVIDPSRALGNGEGGLAHEEDM